MQIHCMADWECMNFEDYRGDHAGMCETQQLMALHPDLVDLDRTEPSPVSGPWCGTDFSKTPQKPKKETGEKIVASQIEGLGHIQKKLLAVYRPIDGWLAPDQNRIEEMWGAFNLH